MRRSKQQEQALAEFNAIAGKWQDQSTATGEYSLIRDRNRVVSNILRQESKMCSFLDVGCGTGQLVEEASKLGRDATGIDFSESMIRICEDNKRISGAKARYISASFFEYNFHKSSFDLISALGFIEYISTKALDELFKRVGALLNSEGTFAIGSRNRIFNVFSRNAYTLLEEKLNNFDNLQDQATALENSTTQQQAMDTLETFEQLEKQPDRHPATNIDVDVRFQYSPADLCRRLRNYGFLPVSIHPVHYHAFPVSIKTDFPEAHEAVAELVEEIGGDDQRMVPRSSTFVIVAKTRT